MKTKNFVLSLLLLATPAVAFFTSNVSHLFAEEGLPIITYQVRPNAFVSSDFCRRLLALPEWEPFFSATTELLDKSLSKELSRNRLEGKLPDEIVTDLQRTVDRGISSRRAIEAFFEHVDIIVFELRADIESIELDGGLFDIHQLLQKGKIDVKIDIDGVLGTVIDVNPRKLLRVLKYLEEGKDYEFLKNETDGDFVIRFHFRFHEHKIGFCCAGVKIPDGDRYALLFSGKKEIDDYVKMFKDGRYTSASGAPVKEVVLAEPCFIFIDQQRKKAGLHSNEADFLGKIRQVKGSFRDVDGVSQVELTGTMRSANDARAMRDLLNGLMALVRLTQNADSQAVKLLDSLKIEVDQETVSVLTKFDNPELWKIIAQVLEKTTTEVKKQN